MFFGAFTFLGEGPVLMFFGALHFLVRVLYLHFLERLHFLVRIRYFFFLEHLHFLVRVRYSRFLERLNFLVRVRYLLLLERLHFLVRVRYWAQNLALLGLTRSWRSLSPVEGSQRPHLLRRYWHAATTDRCSIVSSALYNSLLRGIYQYVPY